MDAGNLTPAVRKGTCLASMCPCNLSNYATNCIRGHLLRVAKPSVHIWTVEASAYINAYTSGSAHALTALRSIHEIRQAPNFTRPARMVQVACSHCGNRKAQLMPKLGSRSDYRCPKCGDFSISDTEKERIEGHGRFVSGRDGHRWLVKELPADKAGPAAGRR